MHATEDTAVCGPDASDGGLDSHRLAELVQHLTDCEPLAALLAVEHTLGGRPGPEPLDVVARAMVSVRRGIDLRAMKPKPR